MAKKQLSRANRSQIVLQPQSLDDLLPADHEARSIWATVESLDLSKFHAAIRSEVGAAGRPAIDPQILITLWLYATKRGIGSARELARRCESEDAFRWICGGVSVAHHTLSDFRVGHETALDLLMTQLLTVLLHNDVITLERVAQDGMRVRAWAGASSFRRRATLEECLERSKVQVEEVKKLAEIETPKLSPRIRAARERAAREKKSRVEQAIQELPLAEKAKSAKDKPNARVSTTDPEARVMKMGDGGFRPAYNVQLAVDVDSRVIVGAEVSNAGSDRNQTLGMLEQVEERTARQPDEYLADGGFSNKNWIEKLEKRGTTVYAPVQKPRENNPDPHLRKAGDSDEIAEWRARMATDEAKETYKLRASTVETVNGDLRTHRGLDRFTVRGVDKARSVLLWAVLAYNIGRAMSGGIV